jgi:hypothetical protein
MMSILPAPSTEAESSFPALEFGRGVEDFPVARVGEIALAMLPSGLGRHYLGTGWRISRPLSEWRLSDFYGRDGELADEAAFRTRVEENAQHQRERRALGRREIKSNANTPWGRSQSATAYAEGIVSHSTASHGGFVLTPARNVAIHSMLRAEEGFYEEDAEWAIVAITFPQFFTGFERRCAEKSVKDSWPDAWEEIFGTPLEPGESYEKDRRAFGARQAASWIVISAIASSHNKGFVECVATLGGKRGCGVEERRFLVPSGEYSTGRFGFVIDPSRHALYGGPSDFVGWQGRSP